MRQSYRTNRLEIALQQKRKASWKTVAGSAIKGTEYLYAVKDANFRSLNTWILAVRVPKSVYGNIIVQPIIAPGKKVWAGIDRKSIVLVRATKNPYRRLLYCKLNLADPSGYRTKLGTRRGDRSALPKWFSGLKWRMRLKRTVSTTLGKDEWAQVILVDRQDYSTMIRAYFAMKVWIMQEGFLMAS